MSTLTSNAKRFPADEAIHHTGQRGPMVVLASDHDAETDRLQRDLALRNEQIDGYERQLGIDKAGAEHTIGSEIERLRGEAEVAGEQLAQLRGFAEAHKTCRGSDETLPVERSAVSDARLQTMIDKPSGRDRHAALLELQRWRKANELKANSCVCGEPNSPGTHRTDGPCLAPIGDRR